MPSITVSEHVLERIETLKQAGETSQEDTLRRILDGVFADREIRLKAYETAEQDTRSTN